MVWRVLLVTCVSVLTLAAGPAALRQVETSERRQPGPTHAKCPLTAATPPPPAPRATASRQSDRRSEMLEDYHITYPIRIHRDGRRLTHDVTRSYDVTAPNGNLAEESSQPRWRRSMRQWRRRRRRRKRRDSSTHYRLQLGPSQQEDVVLDMLPNRRLLAPGFVIERKRERREPGRARRLRRHCLLHGRVRNRAGSSVALSTCKGLYGYIHTGEHQYLLEPVPAATAGDAEPRPHRVYRRRRVRSPRAAATSAREPSHSDPPQECSVDASEARRSWTKEELRWSRRARAAARAHRLRSEGHTPEAPLRRHGGNSRRSRRQRRRLRPGRHLLHGRHSRRVRQGRHLQRGRSLFEEGWHDERPRRRRSVSAERNVETLLVADPDMVEFYANDDIETYLLTVMNGVSQLYHDASIGNAINVILVRIMVLEPTTDSSASFNISTDGDSSLKSFCNWQIMMNPDSEDDPHHHDVAILLTRRNICSESETCNTLGLAEVAGMCQPSRSCNINQDTGLSVSYTVAHELGHNFGMNHDGPSNGCDRADGLRQHVMAPNLVNDVTPVVWSRCSRRDITKFLDRDWGHCLDDQPSELDYDYPELPPGALYNADHQCKLLYGPAASHCHLGDVCETLWCSVDQRCVTKLQPAAEGTRCTPDSGDWDPSSETVIPSTSNASTSMWCSAGKCVEMSSRPGAVDGGWGRWERWGPCSRTCGTGVQSSERLCDRPVPAHGGKYCVGERRRYRTCADTACPVNTTTFRAQQCAEFDTVPYQGENYTWTPVHDQASPCQLTCRPAAQHFTAVLSDTVADGTPCRLDSADICINGKCRTLGCDGVLGSEARADRCGFCHGNGSLCHTVRDTFQVEHGKGYAVVAGVPSGARNIRMEEDVTAGNGSFLAVTSVDNKTGILNDNWFVQWSGELRAAGTVLYYIRDDDNETLFIPGPTNQPIVLQVLLRESGTSVRYEYTVPGQEGTSAQVFSWQFQSWSECSVECGGGEQTSSPACMEDEAGRVEDIYCTDQRPTSRTRPCNTAKCPPRWWSGPWQPCSARCGEAGVSRRQVVCVRSSGSDSITHSLGECDETDRPSAERPCQSPPEHCHAQWLTGPWNQTACAEGPCQLRHRSVWCVEPGRCLARLRPAALLTCDLLQCRLRHHGRGRGHGPQRRVQPAPPGGRRRRRPQSVSHDWADLTLLERDAVGPQLAVHRGSSALRLQQRLRQLAAAADSWHPPAGNYTWKLGPWGQCDADCGDGRRQRHVACVEHPFATEVELSRCGWPIPHADAPCTQPCSDWATEEWAPCSVLCGDGVMTRRVTCPEVGHCDLQRRPIDTLPCRQVPCAQWKTGDWKPCSVTCGAGYRMRTAKCVSLDSGESASGCSADEKPATKQPCHQPACSSLPEPNGDGAAECVDIIKPAVCKTMRKLCSNARFRAKCCHSCAELV